jgi:hypothetical protein
MSTEIKIAKDEDEELRQLVSPQMRGPLSQMPGAAYKRHVWKCDRPYQQGFAREAEILIRAGASRKVLEDWLGVDKATLQRWADDHPEFRDALVAESLDLTLSDASLIHWFKDYCLWKM